MGVDKADTSAELTRLYETSFYTKEQWPELKDGFTALVNDCFPEYKFSPKFIEQMFTRTYVGDHQVTVLLAEKETQRLVGFTTAHIFTQHTDQARVDMTGVASDRRKQKLAGVLLTELKKELKRRGVETLTRNSRIKDGYADAIERNEKDNIIERKEPDPADLDPRRYFKMRL